jgi:ADP-ribosylglycohydrolase
MRIAPLAFCINPLPDESRQVIRDICRITHHNDEAYIGALAVLLAIHRSAKKVGWSLHKIASCLPNTSVRDRLTTYADLAPGASLKETAAPAAASRWACPARWN